MSRSILVALLLLAAGPAAAAATRAPARAVPRVAPPTSPEFSRIVDRAALVHDARSAANTRDWNAVELELCMADGRRGRAARLSAVELAPDPADPCAPPWLKAPPAALRKALLAFLPRGPMELVARRPRRRALRGGVCGRYAIAQWDPARRRRSLIDDAYLTPLEADSLARDVAAAIAPFAPGAARALRAGLGVSGPRPRPAPLAVLRGVAAQARVPVVVRLAPSEGGAFVPPIEMRLDDVPDSLLVPWFGPQINEADDELTMYGGWHAETVLPATMRSVATVLARAAVDDSTGCDPMAQYPGWPASWTVTLFDRGPHGTLVARPARALWTRRIRGRALEWSDHLAHAGEDDTRRVLDALVELGLPPAREFRGVGEDPPVPELPSIAERRDSLLALVHGNRGGTALSAFLGVSLWFHGGPPHGLSWSTRYLVGERGGPTGARDVATPVSDAALRALLGDLLDNPDALAGARRAREEFRGREGYLELRVIERRHGGNPTQLRWVSFVDRETGARVAALLARALAPQEPDAAADLRRQAEIFRTGSGRRAAGAGGS